MAACREELLIYGYIKAWHKQNNVELPPDDVINLFVSWIKLLDSFDRKFCHNKLQLHPEIGTKFKVVDTVNYPTAIGSFVIEKGMKQSWKFNLMQSSTLIGIMDGEI